MAAEALQRSTSTALVDDIAKVLTQHEVSEQAVIVAVSGGADSTALLLVLADLRERLSLNLTAAHLNHRWRPDSRADADWVADLCSRLSVPFVLRTATDAELDQSRSEGGARRMRRQFLASVAHERGSSWVAAAHTADDQVETVLHRLLRGTGPRGLAGMSRVAHLAEATRIIRPLLEVPRSEIERWLTDRRQSWRTDATNDDPRFTRNRIRHALLPTLRSEFNPRVDAAILRLARQCSDVAGWLRESAAEPLRMAALHREPSAVRLSVTSLQSSPRVVVRELFSVLWSEQQWPAQGIGFAEWERLADAALGEEVQCRFQLPGPVDVVRDGDLLRLQWQSTKSSPPDAG